MGEPKNAKTPCMSGTCNKENKVSPDYSLQENEVNVNQFERINGWSCPWHPLQVIAWFFLAIFATVHFGILVNYLPKEWQAPGYIVPACLLTVHIVYHLLCLSLDPSDNAVKAKRSKHQDKPRFDRKKRSHVIENFHCCICQTDVGERSKHCSVCNKCVSDFDHHCKWLNNCVGGQNYRLFIGCIISAFLCGLFLLVVDLYQFVIYFVDQKKLLQNLGSNEWKLFVAVPKEAYLGTISAIGILLLISLGLLAHLIIFHFYLICKNMSTYDYIVKLRDKQLRGNRVDVESGEISPPKMQPIKTPADKTDENADRENERKYQEKKSDIQAAKCNSARLPDEIDGDLNHLSSDPDDDDAVIINTRRCDKELFKMSTAQITNKKKEERKVVKIDQYDSGGDEETPLTDRKQREDKIKQDRRNSESDSVESLKEIPLTKIINNNMLNNSLNSPKKVTSNGRTNFDAETIQSNLHRNSESEKEMDVKESFKKKKIKKKKTKRTAAKKELPPVVVCKTRRPLPKLAAVNEETEP